MAKIEIKYIVIGVGDATVEITIEEAKALYDELGKIFKTTTITYPIIKPVENPNPCPNPYPIWSGTPPFEYFPHTISGNS